MTKKVCVFIFFYERLLKFRVKSTLFRNKYQIGANDRVKILHLALFPDLTDGLINQAIK